MAISDAVISLPEEMLLSGKAAPASPEAAALLLDATALLMLAEVLIGQATARFLIFRPDFGQETGQ